METNAVYLVTSGAHGLSRFISEALLSSGASVVVTWHENWEETEAFLSLHGPRVHAIHAAFENPSLASRLVDDSHAWKGRLDGIVFTSSLFSSGALPLMLAIHVESPHEAALRYHDLLVKDGRRGSFVAFSDACLSSSRAPYLISRKAMEAGMLTLSRLLAPALRVNVVAPGLVLAHGREEEAYFERTVPTLPLGVGGRACDVVSAVLFFLSASSVTGEILHVDGGLHCL